MHELHLMKQVVKAAEGGLEEGRPAKPIIVRVRVRASSHAMAHDTATLQLAFDVAARGTTVEGATVEVVPFSEEAWCPACKRVLVVRSPQRACPTCGASLLQGSDVPEIVVQEVVVEE